MNVEMKQGKQTKPYMIIYNDVYGINLPFLYDDDKIIWMPIREVCEKMEFSKSKIKTELKRFNSDPALKKISKIIKITNDNGCSINTKCIKEKYFILWLLKLDHLSLPDNAYNFVSKVINKASNYEVLKENRNDYYLNTKTFHKEKMLQNYIFDKKQLLDIRILEQEVKYDFGRIDFLGTDNNDNKICIELKCKNEFKDTKEQLLRYKNSGKFNRVIFIANDISDDFKEFLIVNDIEYIKYEIRNQDIIFIKQFI